MVSAKPPWARMVSHLYSTSSSVPSAWLCQLVSGASMKRLAMAGPRVKRRESCREGMGNNSQVGEAKVEGCTPGAPARRRSSHQPAAGGASWKCGSAPSFCAASSGQLGL